MVRFWQLDLHQDVENDSSSWQKSWFLLGASYPSSFNDLMKQITVAFRFERCLETNGHAQTLCKSFLRHGCCIYIITDLSKQEFYNHLCDFALDNGIYHKNVIFTKPGGTGHLIRQLQLKRYFSANASEVWLLNEGLSQPVACLLPCESQNS